MGATPRFHLKSRHHGSSSAALRQHGCLCSRAYITTWLQQRTEGKTISRSGNECTRLSIELTEGGGRDFSRPQINPATSPQQAMYSKCLPVAYGDNDSKTDMWWNNSGKAV